MLMRKQTAASQAVSSAKDWALALAYLRPPIMTNDIPRRFEHEDVDA